MPINQSDVKQRGWTDVDFVYVTGDAYVDHPSFGVSIISRVLEAEGFRVAILSQPDYKSCEDFKRFGRPRLGFLVTSGNIDSMVAHYTVSKKRRTNDYYSPGGRMGMRPDRAVIVYCNRIREAYGDVPIIIGGLEASLRRFAHYDYWDGKVRRSVLVDSRADILAYGMGENILVRLAKLLDRGIPIKKIRDVRGTAYLCRADEQIKGDSVFVGEYDLLKEDKAAYARAFAVQYKNTDSVAGKIIVEGYGDKLLVQNPPMPPLEREELDRVYALPFARDYHPDYEKDGGVPAITEVKFSITHNRGCFGACNFCAIAFHQGRQVRSRSIESVVKEAEIIASLPDFKGYINDVGGPTANFRYPSCDRQAEHGVCPNKKCLAPTPCKNLKVDHSEYAELLRRVEAVKGVKKVFVRSGIRFDYLLQDKDDGFFRQLVERHTSGQLKVAPEHCSSGALRMMGKPDVDVFEEFKRRFFKYSREAGLEQYLVPYLMSSHPGATMCDAVNMALWLKEWGYSPEQVQDFYPTPGTISTVMYYTGIHPLTGKVVEVTTDYREKQLQRALLQYSRPENANMVREALTLAGREDLIGFGSDCLVRPAFGKGVKTEYVKKNGEKGSRSGKRGNDARGQRGKSAQSAPRSIKSTDKLRKTFGEDTERILREAQRLAGGTKGAKSAGNSSRSVGKGSSSATKGTSFAGKSNSSSGKSNYSAGKGNSSLGKGQSAHSKTGASGQSSNAKKTGQKTPSYKSSTKTGR